MSSGKPGLLPDGTGRLSHFGGGLCAVPVRGWAQPQVRTDDICHTARVTQAGYLLLLLAGANLVQIFIVKFQRLCALFLAKPGQPLLQPGQKFFAFHVCASPNNTVFTLCSYSRHWCLYSSSLSQPFSVML